MQRASRNYPEINHSKGYNTDHHFSKAETVSLLPCFSSSTQSHFSLRCCTTSIQLKEVLTKEECAYWINVCTFSIASNAIQSSDAEFDLSELTEASGVLQTHLFHILEFSVGHGDCLHAQKLMEMDMQLQMCGASHSENHHKTKTDL